MPYRAGDDASVHGIVLQDLDDVGHRRYMLTRVGAADLSRHRLYMCGVDTGWITDENPTAVKARRAKAGWRPPLDVVDAAARIYHPIIGGESGTPLSGVLLKDYTVVPW